MTNVRNESGLRVCTARAASLIMFCRTRPLKAWTGSLTDWLAEWQPAANSASTKQKVETRPRWALPWPGRVGAMAGRGPTRPAGSGSDFTCARCFCCV